MASTFSDSSHIAIRKDAEAGCRGKVSGTAREAKSMGTDVHILAHPNLLVPNTDAITSWPPSGCVSRRRCVRARKAVWTSPTTSRRLAYLSPSSVPFCSRGTDCTSFFGQAAAWPSASRTCSSVIDSASLFLVAAICVLAFKMVFSLIRHQT